MSAMNFATVCWTLDSLGLIRVAISVFAGMPRSARFAFAASGEFTIQLMKATAALGSLLRLDAEYSIDALYHALRSVALPARLGNRRTFSSVPAAALTASSWLELEVCIAAGRRAAPPPPASAQLV